MTKNSALRETYLDVVTSSKAYPNRSRLRMYLNYMFADIPLAGRRVLDVGGGTGLLTLWAAVEGADATLLEPESAGSSENMRAVFKSLKSQISDGLKATESSEYVQDYLAGTEEKFDIIMMANCINHIDEENCAALHKNEAARGKYHEFFELVRAGLKPGGALIITDCGRRNFFGDLGLRSPIMPSIEWHIHQSPVLWSHLMENAGFTVSRAEWTPPNAFGPLGRVLLGNRAAAYFLLSHFRVAATA